MCWLIFLPESTALVLELFGREVQRLVMKFRLRPTCLLGGRMLVVIPLPLVGNLSVGVAAISTNDLFTVGVLVDPDACPDADVLIAVTERCFAQLFGSGRLGQERTTQRGCSSSYLRLVSVDDALHQVDQLLQFFVRECGDCRR